jgi:hypothetical protein
MNRRIAALAILALVAVAAIVGILHSSGHETSQRDRARIYCSKEPGLSSSVNSPEFRTCVDQYSYLR